MTDVANLNKARAEREGDANLWTPLDALRDLVKQVEAGEIAPCQIAVHWLEPDGDGFSHGYCVAGVGFPQHISLLEVGKQRVIQGWLK